MYKTYGIRTTQEQLSRMQQLVLTVWDNTQVNPLKEIIKQKNNNKEFYTDEKCFITELSNSADDPDASIAQARVEAGITTHWHR